MLVLTRSAGNKLFIEHEGETLEMVIVKVREKEVRIGFEGSRSFNIRRDDVIKTEISGNN